MRYGESPDTLAPAAAGVSPPDAEAAAPGACDPLSAAIAAAAATVPRTAPALRAAPMTYALPVGLCHLLYGPGPPVRRTPPPRLLNVGACSD
ncbi:hypothetical protein GCM10010393_20220 [Streptomyces gobitricini]|uniref:Uncharacterized protein n=1 Tax=Streptomyces gobitricini TaxID=68211 RepID=A0ABN3LRB5_9ACTN